MNKVFQCVTSAVRYFIAIMRWLLSLIASKLVVIMTKLDTALRNYTLSRFFLEDDLISNVYLSIKALVFSPSGTIRFVAEKISGQSIDRQLEEGLVMVEWQGQDHDQRIHHTQESNTDTFEAAIAMRGAVKKGKAKEVNRKEEDEEEALEVLHQQPEAANLSMMNLVQGSGGRSGSVRDLIPPGTGEGGKHRTDKEAARSTEGLKRQGRAQRITLSRPNPVAIDITPQGDVTRVHGSIIQRLLNSESGTTEARNREKARNQQASRDREQAHYLEQSRSTGLSTPLGAVKDQVSGQSGQSASGGSSRTPRIRFNPLQPYYEGLRYPVGRTYLSIYRRER